MYKFNLKDLKSWFLAFKRDLPWRKTDDPYAIWISEIMLQQTQVSVVIPYYQAWMKRFPTICSLADAPIDEVIKMWEGLGYYSRARNLHAGACYLVKFFNGLLPDQEKELAKIKGLGPYTIGAILSFAFHQKKAAVDGNVLRVLTRYYEIRDDIAKSTTQKKMRQLVEAILPDEEPWVINEALIELGATVCQRKPKCQICPLSTSCKSYLNKSVNSFPVKSKGPAVTHLYRHVLILKGGQHYCVTKGKKGQVMADLYEFPFIETDAQGVTQEELLKKIRESYQCEAKFIQQLPSVTHGFTRYKVYLTPYLLHILNHPQHDEQEWLSLEELMKRPFSSGHRRIFQHLLTLPVE